MDQDSAIIEVGSGEKKKYPTFREKNPDPDPDPML